MKSRIFLLVLLVFTLVSAQGNTSITTPAEYFGFQPGADRQMFDYEKLIAYLEQIDGQSDKLKMIRIGKSPMGRPMYLAFVSSPANLAQLDALKEINRQLALNPDLSAEELSRMVQQGKVFILLTMSMHSNEVGPSQATPLIIHQLITSTDEQLADWLSQTVLMIVPSHNPDGMDMVVNHYRKYLGTKYEGTSMPGVYHKYVGHDNNRDFITLSQEDTRAIARIYNREWFPQVMVEKHQMGSRGPRYFVPPMHDPIAENIDARIWNWTWVFGSNMSKDMTGQGLAGVSQHYLFDDYWPGSTETCLWKNVIGLLTECASCKYATPVYVEPTELNAYGKGLSEYKKSINMTLPWPGGWWRLADIVQYELVSTISMLKTAALHKEEILRLRNKVCRDEVTRGREKPPYYYLLPQAQKDPSELVALVRLLVEHGVQVYRLNQNTVLGNKNFHAGDIVVPLAQPFRAFVKEVMEAQKFPVRHYTPDGKIIRPYDITTWSLPLHRGLTAVEINQPPDKPLSLSPLDSSFNLVQTVPENYWGVALNVDVNESFKIAFYARQLGLNVVRLNKITNFEGRQVPDGSFVILTEKAQKKTLDKLEKMFTVQPIFLTQPVPMDAAPLLVPRIALVETYFHDMDAGWTRFILDRYHIQFTVLRPGDFEKTDFAKKFDVVVFPDAPKSILMEGKWKSKDTYYISDYPPEFTKGIGKKGFQNLLRFLNGGGHIVAWGRSTNLFIGPLGIMKGKKTEETFQLPVNDISKDLGKAGLYIPGALIRIKLKQHHPLTLGMPDDLGVFYRGRPVFTTSIPSFDMDRRVIGWFPEGKLLLSGYAEKTKKLENKAALVWLKKGKGQLVLFAFNPQFRASTQGSFKLLFNALLLE